MINNIIAAAMGASQIVMIVVIVVVIVLMVVMTIIPQKKRQKEQQKMMDSLNVGTKLMTVGGLVGKITQVNSDNTLIVNVGTESTPTLIVIDKKAVGYVLEAVAAPQVVTFEDTSANVEDVTASEPQNVENADASVADVTEETTEVKDENTEA